MPDFVVKMLMPLPGASDREETLQGMNEVDGNTSVSRQGAGGHSSKEEDADATQDPEREFCLQVLPLYLIHYIYHILDIYIIHDIYLIHHLATSVMFTSHST